MAILIKPSGEKLEVIPDGGVFTLEQLQKLAGGYIEAVPTCLDNQIVYVNEDGRSKRLMPNPIGTIEAGAMIGVPFLFGNVLICGPKEGGVNVNEEGEEESNDCDR